MTCFMCKGKNVEDTTTFMCDLGNCIVIIKNVPCFRCTQCGEISYSDEVSKNIQKIIEKLRKSITDIAVTDYKLAA
ncbi:MAG: type II toxin-antitoxin system MqsA family antitoxin [Treponema sp.]|nr:type II toxin-antitoxin system MqsA family antitoxin [Candidatus Treponema caballi]